jgi:phosphatidate cytidylyltransferase
MSPTLALQSEAFWLYAALGGALLAVAGLILGVLKWGLRKQVGHAWAAYCGWLFIVPILLFCFFLGREAVIVLVTLVACLGFREFAGATGLSEDRMLSGAVYLLILATGAVCWMVNPDGGMAGYGLFMALPVFATVVIVAVPVFRDRVEGQLRLLALAVVGFVYFGWMFGHLAFLANAAHAYSCLGYLVVAVELNDVAAYTCGKLFGRHPLRGNISPNKTWEGAVGALVVSLLLAWSPLFPFPHCGAQDRLLAGLVVGVGGQVGDLVISVIKRDLNIKDMGTTIPGHGGILDRIDSLIYVTPLFFHFVLRGPDIRPPA